jgi:hypothetical protein
VQVAWLVAATSVEYLSSPHDAQEAEPDKTLYLPATHATQSPLLPVYPALQRQSAIVVIPGRSVQLFAGQLWHVADRDAAVSPEYLPISQFVHVADPVAVLYCPGTHAVHSCPSSPVYPVLHVHDNNLSLPSADPVFVGHVVHTASDVAATVVEYLFRPQLAHVSGPGITLYLPADQPVHPVAPLAVKSTPLFIVFITAVNASLLMYSSTTNTPAMSPSK